MASSSSIGSPSPGTGGGFSISRISAGNRDFCRTGGTGGTGGLLPSVIASILRENSSGDKFISSGGIGPYFNTAPGSLYFIISVAQFSGGDMSRASSVPGGGAGSVSLLLAQSYGTGCAGLAGGFVSTLLAQSYGTGCAGLAGGFGGGRTALSV